MMTLLMETTPSRTNYYSLLSSQSLSKAYTEAGGEKGEDGDDDDDDDGGVDPLLFQDNDS